MEKCNKVAELYVATLKAMAQIHQFSHHTTSGKEFYGDHLLFERIYNSAQDNVDLAAEKFMGIFDGNFLNYDLQTDLIHKVMLKYKNLEGSPAEMSLAIEKNFIKFSDEVYKCFESEHKLTLGLEDTLAAIASKREESVYLLQQCLRAE